MEWFKQNLISLLLTAIFTITMGLSGYIYNQDNKHTSDQLKASNDKFDEMLLLINREVKERKDEMLLLINREVKERKDEDDKLREKIDNRVSYREFEILNNKVTETNQDVKHLLKKIDL